MNNNRGEVSTLIIVGIILVIVAATFLTTTLNQSRQTTQTKASTGASCDFDSGKTVPLGQTESNAANADVRWPISQHPHEYDVFGSNYFELVPNNDPTILNLTKTDGGDKDIDQKIRGFMGSMVGYKPSAVSAFDMKYNSAPQEDDTDIKGQAPVLQITTDVGRFINVPKTDYNIGGNYEAMVVFASEDRVTIHIGRHEYITTSKMCGSRKCSGGYWIYVKDICVDKQILNTYRSVEAAQRAAGADLNPIQLPMVSEGQPLGVAKGNSVIIGVRDDGPFVSTSKPFYWEGYENGTPPDGSGEQGDQGDQGDQDGQQEQTACMEVEKVHIDTNNNKPQTVKITRKTTPNISGWVKFGYYNGVEYKRVEGASPLPQGAVNSTPDEMGFANFPGDVSFGNYDLSSGKSVSLKVDSMTTQVDGSECRTYYYNCTKDACTSGDSKEVNTPTSTPSPSPSSQPPASQGATTTPTPTPTSNGTLTSGGVVETSSAETITVTSDTIIESNCYSVPELGTVQFCSQDV